jgi:hypothetical protein
MHDTAGIRITHGFGELANQVQTYIECELVFIKVQVEVEAKFVGFAREQDGGTDRDRGRSAPLRSPDAERSEGFGIRALRLIACGGHRQHLWI